MKTSFFPYENICKSLGLANNPDAIDEMEDMMISTAKHGVSIVAIDKESGKLAGAILNKLQDKNTSSQAMYEEYVKKANHKEAKLIFEFLIKFEEVVDPFKPYNADCLIELVFLGVPPEYARRGIGLKLCEVSLDLATELCKGINVKTPLDNIPLPLEPRPQIVTALFTTFKTQKIGQKLNFDVLKKISYEDMYHNGRSYASVIGPESADFTIAAKKILD